MKLLSQEEGEGEERMREIVSMERGW